MKCEITSNLFYHHNLSIETLAAWMDYDGWNQGSFTSLAINLINSTLKFNVQRESPYKVADMPLGHDLMYGVQKIYTSFTKKLNFDKRHSNSVTFGDVCVPCNTVVMNKSTKHFD
uniref:Uncharacterized protein n=1 Tax=Tetranychus urticae TaxID=32264 RepID=T1K8F7_TETUR